MFDTLIELTTDKMIQVVYYAVRLIRHRDRIKEIEKSFARTKLLSEPPIGTKKLAMTLLNEIEKSEQIPINKLDNLKAEKYINELVGRVQKQTKKELKIDMEKSNKLLREFREEYQLSQRYISYFEKKEAIKDMNKMKMRHPDVIYPSLYIKEFGRKAGLKILKTNFGKRLLEAEELMKSAVHSKKKEAMRNACIYLKEQDRKYFKDIAKFGLKNIESKEITILKLNEHTAEILKDTEEADIPYEVKDRTIEAVINLHNEFFNRLLNDLEGINFDTDA